MADFRANIHVDRNLLFQSLVNEANSSDRKLEDKEISKMRKDYKEQKKMKVSAVYPNNKFDLQSLDELDTHRKVEAADPNAKDYLQVGDGVVVRWKNADNQFPYIKFGINDTPVDGVVDITPIIINPYEPTLTGKMWLEGFGFWWNPSKPNSECTSPGFGTATDYEETILAADCSVISVFGYGSGISFSLTEIPPGTENSDITFETLIVDDIEITVPYINLFAGTVTIAPVSMPSSEVKISYKITDPNSNEVFSPPDTTGPLHAINFRGLVMYPNSNNEQIVAMLNNDFESRGVDFVVTPFEETITLSDDPGYSVEPTHIDVVTTSEASFLGQTSHNLWYKGQFNNGAFECWPAIDITRPSIAITYGYYYGSIHLDTVFLSAEADVYEYTVMSTPGVAITEMLTVLYNFDPIPYTLSARFINGVESDQVLTINPPSAPLDGDSIYIEYNYKFYTTDFEFFNTYNQYEFTLSNPDWIRGSQSIPPIGDTFSFSQGDGYFNGLSLTSDVKDNKIHFLWPLIPNTDVHLVYSYNKEDGELFNLTGMSVKSKNLINNSQEIINIEIDTFDATPEDPFDNPFRGDTESIYMKDKWGSQMFSRLVYDPVQDGFTVIAPEGLIWVDRKTGAATKTLWPTESPVTDPYFVGWLDHNGDPTEPIILNSPLPRRSSPWSGITVAGPYVLRGSWGVIGQQTVDSNGKGCPGEPDYSIDFWIWKKKDKKFKLQKQLSVRDLVKDNAGTYPLYIPSQGIVHLNPYGFNYAYSRGTFETPIDGCWPAIVNGSAFVVGCGWAEAEWLKDQSGVDNQSSYADYKIGHDDSGKTILLLKADGSILSWFTIKPDKDYTEDFYINPNSDIEYTIAHTRDGIPSPGPWVVYGDYQASANYNNDPDGSYAMIRYTMTTVDEEKEPNKLMPGIPSFADHAPRLVGSGSGSGTTTYGSIVGEETPGSQSITNDGSNNFYFALSIPYWCRVQNSAQQQKTERKTGTFVVNDFGIGDGFSGHVITFYYLITGYYGQLITEVRDKFISSIWAPDYPTATGATLANPGYYTSYWSTSVGSILETTNHRAIIVPPIITGQDEFGNDEYLDQGVIDITVPWYQDIPRGTLTDVVEGEDYPDLDIIFESGSPTAHAPYDHFSVYDIEGDRRKQYTPQARVFLFKVKVENNKIISEIWRKDISTKTYPFFTSDRSNNNRVSTWTKIYKVLPCGRVIFVLRQANVVGDDNGDYLYNCLDVYKNEDDEASSSLLHRVYLTKVPTPLNYTSNLPQSSDLQMVVTIEPDDGHEVAYIIGKYGDDQVERVEIKLKADLEDEPTVSRRKSNKEEKMSPTWKTIQGIAGGNNTWFWTTEDFGLNGRF